MYHPDPHLEALHRLTVAIEESKKVRRLARRQAWREVVGSKLVSAGVRIGGRAAAARIEPATELQNC